MTKLINPEKEYIEYPNPEHPNIQVRKKKGYSYMIIDSHNENDDCAPVLAQAKMKLFNDEIHFVSINGVVFTKDNFKYKTSNKYNSSKAIDLFFWQYHREIANELYNQNN